MPRIEIIPFETGLLPQAAALLAARHERDRAAMPLLPAEFSATEGAERAIRAALDRTAASGVAAVLDGRVIAYLIGDRQISEVWGRSGWVRASACAYDLDLGPEIVRDLYAALAADWVEAGIFYHIVLLPATDRALFDRWVSLSFGVEQVHALLGLREVDDPPEKLPAGVTIRRATPTDRDAISAMSDVIWRVQTRAPVWGIMLPEQVAETAEGWGELVDDETVMLWAAEVEGEIVGSQAYWPAASTFDQMWIPEDSVHLSVAGTRPALRGRGIGRALTQVGLAAARDAGHPICETDWRSTNLLASRFWPRQGFEPAFYRMTRRVDSRILWARGDA